MITSLGLALFVIILRICSGCGPFRYVSPPAVTQQEESNCVDCSRGQTRFFFVNNCCTDTTKIDSSQKQRMMNATDCGRKGGTHPYIHQDVTDTKVVRGVEAEENEFPWQVAILRTNNTWAGCGAILLSCDPVIVVSAAHCLQNVEPSDIKLAFGAHRMGVKVAPPLDQNEVRL